MKALCLIIAFCAIALFVFALSFLVEAKWPTGIVCYVAGSFLSLFLRHLDDQFHPRTMRKSLAMG